ncbi:hypothetical protein V6V47_04555 [Micromonospora sp. CPCC 205539]|uniref:hypothetical protein n=1 Tax=Micromonospora sp. CPCC 205539 TaxID=3122408 RepID=UPI002FF29B46
MDTVVDPVDMMGVAVGTIVAILVLAVGTGVVWLRRVRASRVVDRAEQLRLARRATQKITRQTRRTRRGSLRGKGGGGDPGLSHDAASGSDGGGTP